jgi:hypothetical protein
MNPFTRLKTIPNVYYELTWPVSVDAGHVTACLHALSGNNSKGMRLYVHASNRRIRHFLLIPAVNARAVVGLFNTFLPDVELTKIEGFDMFGNLAIKLRMTTKNRLLNTKQPELISYTVLSALGDLYEGESITIEWIFGGTRPPVAVPRASMQYETNSWFGMLLETCLRNPKELDPQSWASMQEKYAVHTWEANCFIGVEASGFKRVNQLVEQVLNALRAAEMPGVRIGSRPSFKICMREDYQPFFWTLRINPHELTSLLAWPLGSQQIPGIQRSMTKRLPASTLMPDSSRVIANSDIPGSQRPLVLSPADGLMHTHILGATGVGKTNLLLNLVTQDIAENRGVIVVDPKGDLIQKVLCRIPKERYKDVILLDPADETRPVGLNPLTAHGQSASIAADSILTIFRSLYGSNFGARSQDIVHSGLLTLASVPDMSLCHLPILFTNPTFRNRIVSRLNDPLGLGSFWSWFDTISERERNTAIAPVMNKLRAFLLRPAMRRVIGQGRPGFDLNEVVMGNKILLVNLAKGSLGSETSQLFGSLVVSQIWQAIQARITIPDVYRKPMFLYIDEMQDYLHLPTDIGSVLAQSRSYGVGMLLAHQHINQMPPDLRSGVLSNARSRICFQLSHEDAVTMSHSSNVLNAADFQNLNRYHVYAQLVGNGQVMPWASGQTLAPSPIISNADDIRKQSRQRYGRNAADIEAELIKHITGETVQQSPVGRKRKTGGTV